MRIIVIAQARLGSSRLPGKVLKRIGGDSILSHVARRAKAIDGAHGVCIATSTLSLDDAVAAEAERCGCDVFRGDERDVLSRFRDAARMLNADIILRITCDCPLIDPAVCAALLELRDREMADYASNVATATWPHGLDCEVFTRDVLERAATEAVAEDEREHVTLWMRRNESLRHAELAGPGGCTARQRWVVDYPEDLQFLEALFSHFTPRAMLGWRDVIEVLRAHPEISAINKIREAESAARANIVNQRMARS